jgi:hypothetical protein
MAKKVPLDAHNTPHPIYHGRAVSGRLLPGPAPKVADVEAVKPKAKPAPAKAAKSEAEIMAAIFSVPGVKMPPGNLSLTRKKGK